MNIDTFVNSLRHSKINTIPIFGNDSIDDIFSEFYSELKSFISIYIGNTTINNIMNTVHKWKNVVGTENEDYEAKAMNIIIDIYFTYYIIFETLSFQGEDFKKYVCPTFLYNVSFLLQEYNLNGILISSLKAKGA